MNKKVKVYVYGVDWDYEMEECILHVYPSVKSLKKKKNLLETMRYSTIESTSK